VVVIGEAALGSPGDPDPGDAGVFTSARRPDPRGLVVLRLTLIHLESYNNNNGGYQRRGKADRPLLEWWFR